MKFKSIRSRLVLLTILILGLSLAGSVWIANTAFSRTLRQTTYAGLAANANYLNTLLATSPDSWEAGHFDDYAQSTSTRVTLINKEGVVLFDSDFNVGNLGNHLWREEIQGALENGVAMSERRSDTQKLPVLYYAMKIESHPQIAFLRVSKTLNQLTGYQVTYQKLFLGGLAIILLASLLITTLSITMITRPLQQIKDLARKYATGDLTERLWISSPQELSELSSTMQEMALLLRANMNEVELGKAQLETILDSLSEGILLLDATMVIKVANKEALALFTNEAEQQIIGRKLAQVITSSEVIALCNASFQDGGSHTLTIAQFGHLFGDTAFVVGKRKTRILRLLATPVVSVEGKREAVVLSINDMTELKRLEQIRKEFVANVSHELKTPITSIAGFSDALQEATDSGEIKHFSHIINRQAVHMQHIVEDLLLLSSLEQQNASPTKTWTAPSQILEEIQEHCLYRFEEKHSHLIINLDNPQNFDVFVNGMLLVQALTNLVINALTYSKEGSDVVLGLKLEEELAIFTVEDHGIGIPKDAQQRIFERFYRVDAARSRSQGGTGLGLSIVKHIVAVHNGTVTVESEEGIGSLFTITLPRSGKEINELKARGDSLYQR